MTTTHPMSNARAAAPTPPQHQDHTAHLLRRWCELAALVSAAAAHHPGEEFELFTIQQQVEQVLRGRSPKVGQVIDELLSWEANNLIHSNDVPQAQCLTCRRARVDARLLPIQLGGAL